MAKKLLNRETNQIVKSGMPISKRICVSIPYTGVVRVEWMMARYGTIVPVNWSIAEFSQLMDTFSPFSYAVDDARNMAVDFVIRENFEWLLFIDHDVIIPKDLFLKINDYMRENKYPVVCGWYNAKGNPPEPLMFRGRGNSWFKDWKPGDKFFVDGIPMGCTLISVKLLKLMYDISEPYTTPGGNQLRKVFFTPRQVTFNPETGTFGILGGTEDLWWCDRLLENKSLFTKAGYPQIAKKKYPFLMDTTIKCGHIDNDGRIF